MFSVSPTIGLMPTSALEGMHVEARKELGAWAEKEGVRDTAALPSRKSASSCARPGTTISPKTLEQYRIRGAKLWERYQRELGQPEGDDGSPLEFVTWLLAMKPELASSTWRLYRHAAIHLVEGMPSSDTILAMSLLGNDIIENSRSPRTSRPERRTSATKEKHVPRGDYLKLLNYLTYFTRSKNGRVLVDFLRAGLMTALRPIEWRAAEIAQVDTAQGRRTFLYVLNAKSTNGRSTGVVRTLDLTMLDSTDVACIQRVVDLGRRWHQNGRYPEEIGQLSALLYQVGKKLWPAKRKAYALYTMRHQAIANWKAVLPIVEVAALVGHSVTSTAAEHYGKKRSAWGVADIPEPPRAVQEELALVRNTIRLYEDRHRRKQASGVEPLGSIPEFPVH